MGAELAAAVAAVLVVVVEEGVAAVSQVSIAR